MIGTPQGPISLSLLRILPKILGSDTEPQATGPSAVQLTAELALMSFADASRAVITALKESMPLAAWAVTRRVGDDHVYVAVDDDVYGLVDGDVRPWSESLCHRMVTGIVPLAAADVSVVPAYRELVARRVEAGQLPIGAYAGVPVLDADGGLYGTLCGYDPASIPGLADHVPLLRLLAALLGQNLQAERLRAEARERDALLRWRSRHDGLTGLPNRELFLTRLDVLIRDVGRGRATTRSD